MKVYRDIAGEQRLVGRADIPESVGAVFEVPLFGASSTIAERFIVGAVTSFLAGRDTPVVERAIIASEGQMVELLPGWQPLM
ncbi:hypothetical protein EOD42_25370 [Rhodovarius crocodyli]|uniref:Uncharacterized protein n=1 Tax=Rhodovarius crocodyli TaxID=1979269 RepID=A0A437LV98_9PROT|nr:hypothetical protein [Rhodovarius crocodyli]RVT89297.1 hypothetical protein EOD42_25370 [Rhodovarius crocodyli]